MSDNGMVMAKAAELGQTADQKLRTEALFNNMQGKAIQLGRIGRRRTKFGSLICHKKYFSRYA
jgi:hypothetical protein